MYDENKAKRAVTFINALKHTKGKWRGVPFELLPWQDTAVQVTVSRQVLCLMWRWIWSNNVLL